MEGYPPVNSNPSSRACNDVPDNVYSRHYLSPPMGSNNNDSTNAIFYRPRFGKIDVKAKEIILLASALLLLAFSLFQFYKKWVKHYRDINQGSFTSYYYKYESGSLPVLADSPEMHRKNSARKNWNKLGAAVTVKARIRAINARRKLDEAKNQDPLIQDTLFGSTSTSGRKSSSSFRKSSRPTKWGLVKTIATDFSTGENIYPPRGKSGSVCVDIEKPHTGSMNNTFEGNKLSGKIDLEKNLHPTIHRPVYSKWSTGSRTTRPPKRARLKSRSLDTTEDKYCIISSRNSLYDSMVFDDVLPIYPPMANRCKNVVKSPSIHNGDIAKKVFAEQKNSDQFLNESKKYNPRSRNIYKSQEIEKGRDEKVNITYNYPEIPTLTSTEKIVCTSLKDGNTKTFQSDPHHINLPTSDSWLKISSMDDASQIV